MNELLTPRLHLRPIEPDDAAFYLELVNTEAWIANIGDKGLRTVEAAREAIVTGAMAMREKHGITMHVVRLRGTGEPLGLCGLVRRDTLPDVDIGYGYMPGSWGQGYGIEAGRAVLDHARDTLRLPRVMGITAPFNTGSRRILEKLGMTLRETRKLLDTDARETCIYALDFVP